MKQITLILSLLFFTSIGAFAQLENPVTWSYSAKKTGPNEATVYIKANIEDGWHMYSQNMKPGGPTKTTFTYNTSKDYTLIGKTMEPKPKSKFEKVFNMEVSYFDNQVIFQQKVKLNKGTTNVKGKVEFMVCDATKCLPPDEVQFTIPIK
ncbi:MAG: sugar transporter [Pedobacter sp.]|nr:MAG: sugar transporter [Pedobacter sp.]